MTPYAKYPYATLQSVGGKLTTISDSLSQSNKGASDVNGLSDDQHRIHDAINDYRDEWEQSVRKLGENIGNLGDLSTQVGQMVGQFDDAVAKAIKPGGDGGGSGSGGGNPAV
jgi:hypothetical protein